MFLSASFLFLLLSVFNMFLWLSRRGRMIRGLIGVCRCSDCSVLGFPGILILEEWYFRWKILKNRMFFFFFLIGYNEYRYWDDVWAWEQVLHLWYWDFLLAIEHFFLKKNYYYLLVLAPVVPNFFYSLWLSGYRVHSSILYYYIYYYGTLTV